ncbi:MAG: hypothetical protein ACRCZP_07030, partial [Phycicoccus sp.]
RDRNPVGSAPVALVATGPAAAYLDIIAVTTGYGWLDPAAGLSLAGIVALGGLRLARRWSSELLAVILVVSAAALAPVVAADEFGWVVTGFVAVLTVVGWWAGGHPTRPRLTIARTLPVGAVLLAGAVQTSFAPGSADAAGHLGVGAAIAVATLVTSAVSVRRDPRDVTSSVGLAVVLVGLIAVTAAHRDPVRPTVLAMTAAVLFLAATAGSRRPIGPLTPHLVATAAVSGSVAAVFAVVTGAPERYVVTGLLTLALAVTATAGVRRSRLTLAVGGGLAAVAVLAWSPHPMAMVTASSAVTHDLPAALLGSVLVGGLVAVGWWALGTVRGLDHEVRTTVGIASWALGLTSSATVLVSLFSFVGLRTGDAVLGFTSGHALATVSWMIAASWLIVRGLGRSHDADVTLRIGLLLSAVSVAKLFLYDLAALNG